MRWDIFCQVIDNFGDIGVCWRFSCDLAARGVQVRLWVDDASALAWMAPDGCPGVEVRPWVQPLDLQNLQPSDVWIEAFGCEIAPEFVAACADHTCADGTKPLWINLEYLSAEGYVERSHALPSLVRDGPAAGRQKWFFYPGFSDKTGGLLREADLAQRQADFDRSAWLHELWPRLQHGFGASQAAADEQLVSLFCYEPPARRPCWNNWPVRPGRPGCWSPPAGRHAQCRPCFQIKTASSAYPACMGSYPFHTYPH